MMVPSSLAVSRTKSAAEFCGVMPLEIATTVLRERQARPPIKTPEPIRKQPVHLRGSGNDLSVFIDGDVAGFKERVATKLARRHGDICQVATFFVAAQAPHLDVCSNQKTDGVDLPAES